MFPLDFRSASFADGIICTTSTSSRTAIADLVVGEPLQDGVPLLENLELPGGQFEVHDCDCDDRDGIGHMVFSSNSAVVLLRMIRCDTAA